MDTPQRPYEPPTIEFVGTVDQVLAAGENLPADELDGTQAAGSEFREDH